MVRIEIEMDEREDTKEMLGSIGKDIGEGNVHGIFGGEWAPCFYDVEKIGE